MLIVLSPAKIQNFNKQDLIHKYTIPQFIPEAEELISLIRSYKTKELTTVLNVNNDIAKRSADRYYNWTTEHNPENAKQAILTYNGEVYHGLDADSLSKDDIEYSQNHVRMISGLYGVLRPLDLIEPYRLEMNTKLKNSAGKDLYAFWKDKITENIKEAIKESGKPPILLNLTSNEYSKSIKIKELSAKVINFDFLENRSGVYKPITIYIKKARGLMTRYVIKNRIENIEDLKGFDAEGYWFNNSLSNESKMVFTRG